jgi:hypothetical protein
MRALGSKLGDLLTMAGLALIMRNHLSREFVGQLLDSLAILPLAALQQHPGSGEAADQPCHHANQNFRKHGLLYRDLLCRRLI